MKKSQNLTLFKGPSFPKYKDVFKKFLIWQNVFAYRLGIAKISLKNLNSFLSYQEKPDGGQNDPAPLSPLRVNGRTKSFFDSDIPSIAESLEKFDLFYYFETWYNGSISLQPKLEKYCKRQYYSF